MAAVGRRTPPPALQSIVEAVCAAFRVTHDEIISRRRGQHVALARQVAIYLIREITDYSFPRIGAYFNRDHSTAIHSHTQIARRVTAEAPFRALMGKLKNSLPPIQTISRSTMEI
jgi:chromosomal replication initiator protein